MDKCQAWEKSHAEVMGFQLQDLTEGEPLSPEELEASFLRYAGQCPEPGDVDDAERYVLMLDRLVSSLRLSILSDRLRQIFGKAVDGPPDDLTGLRHDLEVYLDSFDITEIDEMSLEELKAIEPPLALLEALKQLAN